MTNRKKYILDQDDDGHWYYFPVENKQQFEDWLSVQYSDDYDNPLYGTMPDWLKEVAGHPNRLTFENPN